MKIIVIHAMPLYINNVDASVRLINYVQY